MSIKNPDKGNIYRPLPIEQRLKSVSSLDEADGNPADPEKVVDLHTQTDGSDGNQNTKELIDDLWEEKYICAVSDHANVGDEPKTYSSSFYGEELKDSDGEAFSEVYADRYDAIQQNVEDREGVVSWREADFEKLAEDMQIIRDHGSDYSLEELRDNVLNYDMVVMNAFEPDFNPLIEEKETEEETVVREYVENLKEFVKEAEAHGTGFDHVNQAVHDVLVDGELRYVKKDSLFQDLSLEQKEEVLENYRDKLIYAIEEVPPAMEELGAEIGAGLMEKGLTVSIVHPAIIERNGELMQAFNDSKKDKAIDETENFIYGHEKIPAEGSEMVEDSEVVRLLGETDIENMYPEPALREFWEPVIGSVEEADNVVLEINGKHVERYTNSVLWEMVDEFIPGSDQHRKDENKSRSRKTKNLDLDAEVKQPVRIFENRF